MKGKVTTRLLSVLLTLAMLIGLMPAAFAASSDIDLYVGLGEEVYLKHSYVSGLSYYNEIEYFAVYAYGYPDCPDMYNDNDWYTYSSSALLDFSAFSDFNFYADSRYVDSDKTYHYDIDFYGWYGNKLGTVDVYVTVGDGYSSGYTDGEIYAETDAYGVLDLDYVADEIYDIAYKAFKNGDPEDVLFSTSDGVLNSKDDGTGTNMNNEWVGFYSYSYSYGIVLDQYVYFLIDKGLDKGEIKFTVVSNNNRDDPVYGTIYVSGGAFAGDIQYSTQYNTEVYFDSYDFEDLLTSSQTLEYVTFTQPSSKGTLYYGNSKVKSTDKFYSDDLDGVSFYPATGVSGNVTISFTLYYTTKNSTTPRPMNGTVSVSVDDGTTISYTGEVGVALEFDAADFDAVCYDVYGGYLDYVTFSASSSKGTLYALYTGSSKTDVTAKSSTKFYVDPGSKEYGLDDVVFVPSSSGTVELTYTAYYYTSSSSIASRKSFTGTVKITSTTGILDPIRYTVSGSSFFGDRSVTFSASDFTAALRTKTTKTLSSVTFDLPKSTEGTLYYNGTTKVSASTQYKATGSVNLLDKVSFVPAYGVLGSVTIGYTAKDSSGNTYAGTVVVQTFAGQDTVISYSTTGTAATFKSADFTTACFKKLATTLSSVQFTLPNSSQGTLYYGWGTSQQARVSASSKYLAATHLPYVSFVPKAGFSGTATITYTGYDTTGGSYTGTIQVTVTPPTNSSNFADANASWIAPSADFLQANNVYSGVVSGSTLGVGTAVTRGEVMQLIYNAFLKNKTVTITSNFTDVPVTHRYYTAINAGYALGIAQGVGNGRYDPDALITREDACTLLYRAFKTLGLNMVTGTADDLKTFGDYAKVSSYAVDGVAGMIKSGIILGDQNHNISPKSNLTRGEISVIIHRAMTL